MMMIALKAVGGMLGAVEEKTLGEVEWAPEKTLGEVEWALEKMLGEVERVLVHSPFASKSQDRYDLRTRSA